MIPLPLPSRIILKQSDIFLLRKISLSLRIKLKVRFEELDATPHTIGSLRLCNIYLDNYYNEVVILEMEIIFQIFNIHEHFVARRIS